jgi:hypothetical protein
MPAALRVPVISALLAGLAVLASAAALWMAYRVDQRLELDEKRQTAAKVYLAEAPRYAYRAHPESGSRAQWVVMNFAVSQVADVWVEGTDFTSVTIANVRGCTMYALPVGFRPIAVNFQDAYGRWRVPIGGLAELGGKEVPPQDTADSPWWLDVQNCP